MKSLLKSKSISKISHIHIETARDDDITSDPTIAILLVANTSSLSIFTFTGKTQAPASLLILDEFRFPQSRYSFCIIEPSPAV